LVALSRAVEELLHAAGHLLGAVDGEGELGDVTDAHPVAQLRADIRTGSDKTLESGGFLFLVAMDSDKDAGRFAARREDDVGNVTRRDARIGELSFKHGTNLF
jgi:hypothetical protein